MEKRKRWGASPAVRFMGQGDKAARARTCTSVRVLLQRIFGFSRHFSPPGRGGNRRGRMRVCHARVHHHWPPREVHEGVTALGVGLGARRELCRTGGAAGMGGGRSIGGLEELNEGSGTMAGVGGATITLDAAAALATARAEASPGATAAECQAAAASPVMGGAAVAEGTDG